MTLLIRPLLIRLTALNQSTDASGRQAFFENFDLANTQHLDANQQHRIKQLLWSYKDAFVTAENPDISLTALAEHRIHVNQEAKLPHQSPYRLYPEKKVVLRYQLEELFKRGMTVPEGDHEELPNTSPIVLATKQKVKVSTN